MSQRIAARTVLLGAVLALGIAGNPRAQHPDATPGGVVFLNRQGGVYRPGFADNPVINTSPIVRGTSVVPAFGGDDDDWETVLNHVRIMFAPFDVSVVDQEPDPATFYIEAVVGGRPESIGFSGLLGVAPVYCIPARRSIVFIFSEVAFGDNILIAETAAHEVGHAFSLDHKFLCKDPMSYLVGCGEKRFQNRTVACGEGFERGCFCGNATQNSFDTIRDAFGSRDGSIRPRAAAAPGEASQPLWICETPNRRRPIGQ